MLIAGAFQGNLVRTTGAAPNRREDQVDAGVFEGNLVRLLKG